MSSSLRDAPGLRVVAFPASWLRVRHGARRTLDQARAEAPRAVVLVDGPMFTSSGVTEWTLRDQVTGLSLVGSRWREGVALVVEGDHARVTRPPAPSTASVVVGLWPPLVEGGRVVATDVGTNAERVWRVGLGATSAGLVVAVAALGPMTHLARALVEGGAIGAGYTDGGSSSALWVDGAGVVPSLSTPPRVPAWIAAEPPPGAPSPSSGSLGWALGAGALGLAIGGCAAIASRRTRARVGRR